ncbi:MAG: hypothetical protein IKF19_02920 [Bacilli bacterium]|nr:hypothetical protein [Bacilli bacterium]
MRKVIHKNIPIILILLLTIYYFEYSVTITYDSAHYMHYVSIFEGNSLWNSWDVVRGPIFPIIIFLSNLVFGKTSQGLIMNSYIYYLVMIIFVYRLSNYCFDAIEYSDKKKKKYISIIIFSIIINPIIYGFYHCLLTEFVAITLTMISIYLAILWLNIDVINKKYITYSILFILLTIIAWFLKQPYVSCSLFVFITTYIVQILENKKIKNITIRTCTLIICIIFLIISIQSWNAFLKKMGNNPDTSRNPTNSLGFQLIEAIDFIKIENNKNINIDKLKFSAKEKVGIKKLIKKNISCIVINHYKKGKIIESDYLIGEEYSISMNSSIKYITSLLIRYPDRLIKSYLSNYLSIIDIYSTNTTDGVKYRSNKKVSLTFFNELLSLGNGLYSYGNSNIYEMPKSMYNKVKYYKQYRYNSNGLNILMYNLGIIYLLLFKVLFLLLPLLLIMAIILKFINKNNTKYNNILNVIIIIFGFSLLHLLLHVITGAIIDRYVIPVFIPVFIATIMLINLIIRIKKSR